jgi:methenyltetrahydrofolate cyclohydrolase
MRTRVPLIEERIEGFLHRVAEVSPTLPAGGSVAALTGALGAALGRLVAQLSRERSRGIDAGDRFGRMAIRLEVLERRCTELMDLDVAAYERLMGVLRVASAGNEPRPPPAETQIDDAWMDALAPPRAMAECGLATLRLCLDLVRGGYVVARADAGVAAELAHACLRGALWLAEANLSKVRKPERVDAERATLTRLREEAEQVYEIVQREMGRRV